MNRELIGKAAALLLSYREFTGDHRIANKCGEVIAAIETELAKPEQTDLRKAAEMALEWIEAQPDPRMITAGSICNALRQALAQPEHPLDKKADNARELGLDYEPVQEPVAWIGNADFVKGQFVEGRVRRVWWECNTGVGQPLYTEPPRKES